jgi:hypothetical protein
MLVERSGKAPKGTLPALLALLALMAFLAFAPCLSLLLATWCKSEQPSPAPSLARAPMAAAAPLIDSTARTCCLLNPHPDVAPSSLLGTLLQPSAESCLNVLHSVTLLNLAVFALTLTLIYLISSR